VTAQIIRFPVERRVAQIARALAQRPRVTDLTAGEVAALLRQELRRDVLLRAYRIRASVRLVGDRIAITLAGSCPRAMTDPLSIHVEGRRLQYGYDGSTKWENTA